MSCADVCVSHDHGMSVDFNTSRWVTAAKQHKCCECRAAIAAGQRYERAAGKCDGHFFTAITCAVCAEVRDAFVCDSWVYGDLWESINEGLFPVWRTKGAWDCLAKLTTPEAVEACNHRYREWLRDNDYDDAPGTPEVL